MFIGCLENFTMDLGKSHRPCKRKIFAYDAHLEREGYGVISAGSGEMR